MDEQNTLLEELRQKAAQLVEAKSAAKSKEDTEDEEKMDDDESEVEFDGKSDDKESDDEEDKKDCDESEELDELSSKTLKSYYRKASADRTKAQDTAQKYTDKATTQGIKTSTNTQKYKDLKGKADAAGDRMVKRTLGTDAAGKRLGYFKEGIEMEDLNIESIFEGEELSEEFKIKATALFEAAVAQKVSALEESYAQAMEQFKAEQTQAALTESEEFTEGLVERVDGYLDYMVEQWIENNELALERGIKSELFESFMVGMKGLFEEHMINVPEEQIEVLDELNAVNEELEQKADALLAENVELKQTLKEIAKQNQIMEAVEGLSELEVERFVQLAEGLSYDDVEVFGKKLAVIRESFFDKEDTSKQLIESVVTDEPIVLEEETAAPRMDPSIAAYVSALSRTKI